MSETTMSEIRCVKKIRLPQNRLFSYISIFQQDVGRLEEVRIIMRKNHGKSFHNASGIVDHVRRLPRNGSDNLASGIFRCLRPLTRGRRHEYAYVIGELVTKL
jgi:hypothetical protein